MHERAAVRGSDPGHRGGGAAGRLPLSAEAGPAQGIRARLYDDDGLDHEVALRADQATTLKDRQLLWIDLDTRDRTELGTVASAVGIDERLVARLANETGRADLIQYRDHIHLTIEAMDLPSGSGGSGSQPVRQEIDVVAGRNWVVTVHEGPAAVLARLDQATDGDTRLGALDAAGFLASIVDEMLAGYLNVAEGIGQEIDRLDEQALRRRPGTDVLARIVSLRRSIGTIRHALAPHRVAFAALARPEMDLHEELGRPWPDLNDRLERAVYAVEGLRDLLLGTFDIHMGRAAQDANEVMKILTLLSALLLPAIVLAGIMGMNFQLGFFDGDGHFWLVIGAMVLFGVTLLAAARWRGWA